MHENIAGEADALGRDWPPAFRATNRLHLFVSVAKWKKQNKSTQTATRLASMKGSMCSMRAWVRLMMNWLTQAMAWDLQRNRCGSGVTQEAHLTHMLRAVNAAPCPVSPACLLRLQVCRRLVLCGQERVCFVRRQGFLDFAERRQDTRATCDTVTLVPDYPNQWCNRNKSGWLKRNRWSKFKSNAKGRVWI